MFPFQGNNISNRCSLFRETKLFRRYIKHTMTTFDQTPTLIPDLRSKDYILIKDVSYRIDHVEAGLSMSKIGEPIELILTLTRLSDSSRIQLKLNRGAALVKITPCFHKFTIQSITPDTIHCLTSESEKVRLTIQPNNPLHYQISRVFLKAEYNIDLNVLEVPDCYFVLNYTLNHYQ